MCYKWGVGVEFEREAETNPVDAQYHDLVRKILDKGDSRQDRTGTGTLAIFGEQLRFNLSGGKLPLITTKRVFFRGVTEELLWFLKGSTNVKPLQEKGVTIWDEWADENGELGPVYGKQWRSWMKKEGEEIDQITQVIDSIKNNPYSRRHIVSAWNVGEIDQMALPPCHLMFQFFCRKEFLDCQMYQRSVDVFLGLPFNIASYAVLSGMMAQVTGHKPGELILALGDTHLYQNHLEQAKLQIQRTPFPQPKLWLNPDIRNIDDFKSEDIKVLDYQFHPAIKAEISK